MLHCHKVLSDMPCVVMYIDDILIFTKKGQEQKHDQITKKVLKTLQDNNLFLKAKKCFFKKKEIEFLGVWVSKNRVHMDSKKVWVVTKWPCPS